MGSVGDGKIAAAESVREDAELVPPLQFSENSLGTRTGEVSVPNRRDCDFAVLPPPHPQRWGIRMKANVVDAVRQGHFSLSEVCERYELSSEEYLSWQRSLERFGLAGLRQRHIQSSLRSVAGREQ